MKAGIVALCSGLIGTSLFFAATDSVRDDPTELAAVEATQAAQLPFTFLLEHLLLGTRSPSPAGLAGIMIIAGGLVGHAWLASRTKVAAATKR
jgi:hypothetical protein